MSRFRMRAGTGILSQDRWHLRDTSWKERGGLGKKDNGGTQREFEESWRDPREGAYVCARMGRRMTPLRLARSDCPIVTRDRRDRFHLWSRMVMTPRRRRKREWRGSHRSSGSGRKWVNRAVRQDEELRAGIRI